jgi:excisionase family DNA binding protein
METNSEDRLVNIRDAAKYLAVSESTLYGWVWQRKIAFVKLGRALRFDLADLRSFVEASRIRAREAGNFSGN